MALKGDVDVGSLEGYCAEIDAGIAARRAVLVDFSDCTFLDLGSLRRLRESYVNARGRGLAFAAVVPFSASATVRRLVLELASAFADFPVFPTSTAAEHGMARARLPLALERMRELRADVWANGIRREELLARRDELILEQRVALAARLGR